MHFAFPEAFDPPMCAAETLKINKLMLMLMLIRLSHFAQRSSPRLDSLVCAINKNNVFAIKKYFMVINFGFG